MRKHFIQLILITHLAVITSPNVLATPLSNVIINGLPLSVTQLHALETSVGVRVAPGAYMVNAQGCWLNMSTGQSGCLNKFSTYSRYGSGERTSDGSWNHYSNSAEMGVGGTSDGCIYTTSGWSNC